MRDRTAISLVRAEREADSEADQQRLLQRINERRARAGLEPVESVDGVDEKFRSPDIFLRETIEIAADYINSMSGNARNANRD
jgi:carboxyl-terminal processing protease